MVHVPAKFRENTSIRFRVTVRKLNVTDRHRRTGGVAISPVPGPTAIIMSGPRTTYMSGVHVTSTWTVCRWCVNRTNHSIAPNIQSTTPRKEAARIIKHYNLDFIWQFFTFFVHIQYLINLSWLNKFPTIPTLKYSRIYRYCMDIFKSI